MADRVYRVFIGGRLTRVDLKRLERVCGPALEHRELPLEIQLANPNDIDESARFFLNRLLLRGAVVVGPHGPIAAGTLRDTVPP